MRTKGILYLVIGKKHYPRLVVSLYSLRKHYAGEIAITFPENEQHPILQQIADDSRLRINLVPWKLPDLVQQQPYVAKAMLQHITPYDHTLFLDADTLIVRPLDDLWITPTLTIVQMAQWTTHGPIMTRRVNK